MAVLDDIRSQALDDTLAATGDGIGEPPEVIDERGDDVVRRRPAEATAWGS